MKVASIRKPESMTTDFGAEHTVLLYYCDSRWLSRGKVLQRMYELRNEIATFLCENKNKDGNLFTDDYFIKKTCLHG